MSEAAVPDRPAGGAPSAGRAAPHRLLSDERLARRAAKGDRPAFEAIYRRYHQRLYRFCLAMCGSSEDAQDALQNTMVKVLRALPGESRQIRLKPWLYRIARNESVEILRRRRDGAELDLGSVVAAERVAETAEARERLRGLIADLKELPERQRAALVMREMGGLGFEQIGDSFETSAAVARQTVYEARLGLRQMEAGREMGCDEVAQALSDADGRVTRRRDVRAHLRSCAGCRAFRDGIARRRGDFAAIAPLPLAVSAGLLQGALGAGAAKAVATSAIVKSAATVAVVAAVGVTAADRRGLIDAPVLGGGKADSPRHSSPPGGPAPQAGVAAGVATPAQDVAASSKEAKQRRASVGKSSRPGADGVGLRSGRTPGAATKLAGPRGRGPEPERGRGEHGAKPDGLPAASKRGQKTAAAQKAPQARTSPGRRESPAREAGGKSGSKQAASPSPAAAKPPSKRGGSASSPAPPRSSRSSVPGEPATPAPAGGETSPRP